MSSLVSNFISSFVRVRNNRSRRPAVAKYSRPTFCSVHSKLSLPLLQHFPNSLTFHLVRCFSASISARSDFIFRSSSTRCLHFSSIVWITQYLAVCSCRILANLGFRMAFLRNSCRPISLIASSHSGTASCLEQSGIILTCVFAHSMNRVLTYFGHSQLWAKSPKATSAACWVRPRYWSVSTLSIVSGTYSLMSPVSEPIRAIVIHPLSMYTWPAANFRRSIVEDLRVGVVSKAMVEVGFEQRSCGRLFQLSNEC